MIHTSLLEVEGSVAKAPLALLAPSLLLLGREDGAHVSEVVVVVAPSHEVVSSLETLTSFLGHLQKMPQ